MENFGEPSNFWKLGQRILKVEAFNFRNEDESNNHKSSFMSIFTLMKQCDKNSIYRTFSLSRLIVQVVIGERERRGKMKYVVGILWEENAKIISSLFTKSLEHVKNVITSKIFQFFFLIFKK